MKDASCCTLCVLLILICGSANATGDNDKLKACLDMQGKVPMEKVLECYNQATQEQLANSAANKPFKTARNNELAEEWTPSDGLLRAYKQNYFLVYSHSSQPNNAPSSPNPNNQAPYSYPLDNKEMKFQLSVKGHLLGGDRHTLWFGYTQLSFWQIYDAAHSTPFRESNYEPELIYSFHPEHPIRSPGMNSSLLNVGVVHQSNGQTFPRSRGWNRVYIQVGLERDFGENGKLKLLPRWWKRIGGGTPEDDNPDIVDYLGRGDLEARYYYQEIVMVAIARIRSLQMDLSIPAPKMFGIQIRDSNLHLQYFDGYGESLIDYNQRHRTIGLGISMPFE